MANGVRQWTRLTLAASGGVDGLQLTAAGDIVYVVDTNDDVLYAVDTATMAIPLTGGPARRQPPHTIGTILHGRAHTVADQRDRQRAERMGRKPMPAWQANSSKK